MFDIVGVGRYPRYAFLVIVNLAIWHVLQRVIRVLIQPHVKERRMRIRAIPGDDTIIGFD